jgi:SAM-dependent methyltransferase
MPRFTDLRRRRGLTPAEVWDAAATIDARSAAAAAPDQAVEDRKTVEQVAALLPHVRGDVLDLGCGYGRIAVKLLEEQPELRYQGVDASTVMLAAAPAELDVTEAALDALPFPDASFDTVFTVAVMLHNDRAAVRRAVEEARRVLRPGGAFVAVASFPNLTTVGGLQNMAQLARFALAGKGDENGPVRPWSRRAVQSLFRDYSTVDVRPSGFAPVPKSLVFHNDRLNAAYRRHVYDRAMRAPFPAKARAAMCAHHDVVAAK